MVQRILKSKWKGIAYFSLILILIFSISNINRSTFASSSIVINEFLYDPIGSDLGYEWIELYNPLNTPITLTGWKIQVAGTVFTDSAILVETIIESKSYILICESKVEGCDIYVSKLAMQNGGGASDGIQILDSKGNVIDTVIYDTPNTNNLTKEDGTIVPDNQTASTTGSGKSLGRKNMIDTDNSYNDFYVFETPTPKQANSSDTVLQPTGHFPTLLLLILLFILLTYSDRLNQYRIILISKFNATFKNKDLFSGIKESSKKSS